jgi:uncharacterized protein
MLIRFEVANFRSILEPAELSMVAIDRDRPAAREVEGLPERLLTVAAIFGPNASGKSNVIAALTWLRTAVAQSLLVWEDDIPVEPFAFGTGPSQPTAFTVESLIGGVRYEYSLELTSEAVIYEGLFHYPERRRRRVFERSGTELTLQRGLGALSGTRELLTSRALVLSIARRFEEPSVNRFARELLAGQTLGLDAWKTYADTVEWFEEPRQLSLRADSGPEVHPQRERALSLLQMADLGVDDVLVDDESRWVTVENGRGVVNRSARVRLMHRSTGGSTPLPFSAESAGTRTWFRLIGPALSALDEGSLLLFDELDASLHPGLSAELVRLFQDPVVNPNGAQLVFTTHDTSLLNYLNRDEVWLTEKSDEGTTRLGALSDFAGERVRTSQNLERAYLGGRFGALPDVDKTELLRSLGLIG